MPSRNTFFTENVSPGENDFGILTIIDRINPKKIAIITGEIGLLSKPSKFSPKNSQKKMLIQVKKTTATIPGTTSAVD